ncbi:MAG: hypothetical protein GWO39_13545, partial [Gammaproteobacteria bacterium]|nr:hypothetical protein [Gammaproteobacteria bacterium]NIR99113.1 hypothetical protein [Gammaproteobacteria bacterium]NIT64747.1 hypothetical protein [Gammaproteobacteria bacterium]NIV21708.1 hypothetical protein [Gammaproteobacteria bacterium]NIY33327.1 hypothetical protein [Gammaproteobacteria bacterium]
MSERLHLELGGYRREVHLVGRIPTDADTRAALDGLMIADIATVQELL